MFSQISANLKVKNDKFQKVVDDLKDLAKKDVLVGYPDNSAARQYGKIRNAQLAFLMSQGARTPKWAVLKAYKGKFGATKSKQKALGALEAYIHSKGSPYWNIPARPFLEPAVEAHQKEIQEAQSKIIQLALEGKPIANELKALGIMADSFAKGWFTDSRNGWAQNSPLIAALKGSDKPLIDTGALRAGITYVVRENK